MASPGTRTSPISARSGSPSDEWTTSSPNPAARSGAQWACGGDGVCEDRAEELVEEGLQERQGSVVDDSDVGVRFVEGLSNLRKGEVLD